MRFRRMASAYTTSFSEGEIHEIQIEVMIKNGLQRFDIIGLPQHMIREGRDRILSALASMGIELPTQKLLVSLNPGSLRKEGSHFDLPIFYAILKALGHIPNREDRTFLWGELSLQGRISPPTYLVPSLLYACRSGAKIAFGNFESDEFRKVRKYFSCYPVSVENVTDLLKNEIYESAPQCPSAIEIDQEIKNEWLTRSVPAWDRLRASQDQLTLWALAILGRHHILLSGAPGIGKTSWAIAASSLQIPLPCHEWAIHSSQILDSSQWGMRPFVAPHHSSSRTAVIGGGNSVVLPGALSRAHGGILFLDEIAEFSRDILEALREPLEQKTVTIARGCIQKTLPADCQIIATMNPCGCGYGKSSQNCPCTTLQFDAYRRKISGPIRDRFHFDIEWEYKFEKRTPEDSSLGIKRRLLQAHRFEPGDMSRVRLPQFSSPRQEVRWMESFMSWCKWHQISKPTELDSTRFCAFITPFRRGSLYEFERTRRA